VIPNKYRYVGSVNNRHIWNYTVPEYYYKEAPPRAFILKLNKLGFTYINSGRHRATFLAPCGTKVYKFPIGMAGVRANKREFRWWKGVKEGSIGKREKWKKRIAWCNLIKGRVIVMERLKEIKFESWWDSDYCKFPKWAERLDCCQVGKNKKGKWVFYDYAE